MAHGDIGSGGHSAPAVTLDHVFVAADDGLYTFSLTLVASGVVGIPMNKHSDPVVDANGTVYAITTAGSLQAYGGAQTTSSQLPGVEWVAPSNDGMMSYAAGQTLEALFPNPFTGEVGIVSDLDGILCTFSVTNADEAMCMTTDALRIGVHRLTVHATDAEGTQQSAQVLVDVVNTAPTVTITSPLPTDTFSDIDMVPLAAGVFDPDEASFPAGKVKWTSNLDGVLGTGPMLSTQLTAGMHTITVRATDEMGAFAEANIVVDVVVN
jgi:hypothetical protein